MFVLCQRKNVWKASLWKARTRSSSSHQFFQKTDKTNRQTDRQKERQTDENMQRKKDQQTKRQTWTERRRELPCGRHKKNPKRQTDKKIYKETDRKKHRQKQKLERNIISYVTNFIFGKWKNIQKASLRKAWTRTSSSQFLDKKTHKRQTDKKDPQRTHRQTNTNRDKQRQKLDRNIIRYVKKFISGKQKNLWKAGLRKARTQASSSQFLQKTNKNTNRQIDK